jgi:VWFA-related protein
MKRPGCTRALLILPAFLHLLILSSTASTCLFSFAQQPSSAPNVSAQTAEPGYKLRVQTNEVIVRATVRDSQGHAVAGLTQDDFRISDNHRKQVISGFSVEKSPAASSLRQPAPAGPAPSASAKKEVAVQSAEPLTFLALYFDDLNSAFDSVVRSREAAEKFIAGLPSTERIAIFTSSGATSLDFTDDRGKLHQALLKLHPDSRGNPRVDCPEITDYLAGQIVNMEDPNAYRILTDEAINECHLSPRMVTNEILRMQAQAAYYNFVNLARADLDNLDGVVSRIALMPGERQVMLVSDGFIPLEMNSRMERMIDHALRAHVIISALDGKGLAVMMREADASRTTLPGPGMASLYHFYDGNREFEATSTLANIAQGTGGQFFHDNNDLLEGFRKTLSPPEVSYILTFSPEKLKYDGAFHNLKVTLEHGHGMKVQARKGYFAPKGQLTPEEQAKGRIREAVFTQETIHDLPLSVQTHVTKIGTQGDEIEVQAVLDARSLAFQKQGDRNIDNVTFIVALFDHDGKLVSASQQKHSLALKSATLASIKKSGISFHAHILVKAGTYTVRVVVRDTQGSGMAALSKAVTLPL